MVLTIDSKVFADARIQGVTLHSMVGAYELRFGLLIVVGADTGGGHRRAVIDGARVSVRTNGSRRDDLGFARSDRRLEMEARSHQDRYSPTLSLTLQLGQLAAIDKLRGVGDLDFDLEIMGTGYDRRGASPVQESLRCHVARSDWIGKLRAAEARDILLLEVPLPFPERSERWQRVADQLLRAQDRFRNGDYHACVGACRTTVEELGCQLAGRSDWAGPYLDRLSSKAREMSKSERLGAILGTLRHYTNQAHHGQSEGGEVNYSRADAQLILTLTASFVAYARSE